MSGRDDREGLKHFVPVLFQEGFYDESLFLGSQPGEPEKDDASTRLALAEYQLAKILVGCEEKRSGLACLFQDENVIDPRVELGDIENLVTFLP